MASVRKPHVAAVLGALGVAAAVTAVYYTIRVNEKNRAKMAEEEPTTDKEFGVANTGEPFFNDDQVSSPTTLHQVFVQARKKVVLSVRKPQGVNSHEVPIQPPVHGSAPRAGHSRGGRAPRKFDVPPLNIPAAPARARALVICAKGQVEISLASKFAEQSQRAGASVLFCPPDVEYVCNHAKAAAGTYDVLVVESAGAEGSSGVVLGEVLKLLKPGGKVAMMVDGDSDLGTARLITKRGLTFAGFLNVAPSLDDWRVFTGVRPAWEVGAAAPVRLPVRKPITETITIAPAGESSKSETKEPKEAGENGTSEPTRGAKTTWKITLDDDLGAEGADNELVDEDALLAESGPLKRATEKDSGGCSKRRRACKGCSCGRAESELSEAQSGAPVAIDDLDALTSACGNCSKGDAFRCAGCPFLGKPAFEKGQEKQILLADLGSLQDG